jgi:hypothetical protein
VILTIRHHPDENIDERIDTRLGPFYDLDGTEILPMLTEATEVAIERIMGNYQVRANIPSLDGTTLLIDARLVTRYIQEDWDRVMGKQPDLGFLPAYWSVPKAVGRLAEEIVCRQLLEDETLLAGDRARRLFGMSEAAADGLVQWPKKGVRCDDLLLETERGCWYLVESKASLTGRRYLRRSVSKAWQQTLQMLAVNPGLSHVLYIWTSLREHFVIVLALDREQAQSSSTEKLRRWLGRTSHS